jgi:hypothetical protein
MNGSVADIEFADPVADREAQEESVRAYEMIKRWAEPFPNDDITRAINTVIKHQGNQIEALSKRLGIEHTEVELLRDKARISDAYAARWRGVMKELDKVNGELGELVSAAKAAIPDEEHPKDLTPDNWAWQIRMLGEDRRAAYRQRGEDRAENARLRAALKRIADGNISPAIDFARETLGTQ